MVYKHTNKYWEEHPEEYWKEMARITRAHNLRMIILYMGFTIAMVLAWRFV